ncbi:MAG: sulfite exporter TauE/SafE family protein [Roseobacter sp.]
MPDVLSALPDIGGLIWLFGAVCVAGVVRGFSGFGSGMILMAVASSVLNPVSAVLFVLMAEILGPLPNLKSALREGARRDVAYLLGGAILTMPIGIYFLAHMSAEVFGWIVSVCVLVLLFVLMSGWRFKGVLNFRLTLATGALGGFFCGFAGIPGPPVILLYMSSRLPIAVIRANFLLYLMAMDLIMIVIFWGSGLLIWQVMVLGLLAGIPNVVANFVGARFFNPDAETVFRRVAYLIIATSAIIGLPFWS